MSCRSFSHTFCPVLSPVSFRNAEAAICRLDFAGTDTEQHIFVNNWQHRIPCADVGPSSDKRLHLPTHDVHVYTNLGLAIGIIAVTQNVNQNDNQNVFAKSKHMVEE